MSSPDSDVATAEGKTIVSPARFHHVGIKTRQPEEMIGFYRQVLGVEPVVAFPFATFMTYDDEANHRLVIFGDDGFDGEADPKRIGLHHLAYEYDSLDDLLDNYERLKGAGREPIWVTDHGPTISFYYLDPDGNQIELQVDNFGSAALSKAFMQGETFAANPLGADIDPEKLLAAKREGASATDLHERAYAGEFIPEGGPTGPVGIGETEG